MLQVSVLISSLSFPGIVGFAEAARIGLEDAASPQRMTDLLSSFLTKLKSELDSIEIKVNGPEIGVNQLSFFQLIHRLIDSVIILV